MNKFLLSITILITLSTGSAQSAFDSLDVASIERSMLEQIQLGESLYRDDIVKDAVARLYRIYPQHPQGLLAELRLAVHLDDLERARELLVKLKQVVPESEMYQQGAFLLKFTEPDMREKLAQGRLYAAAGRFDEARVIYDELLQKYYPSADLAVEYWQVRTHQAMQRPLAITALTDALQTFAKHPSLFRALVDYHFQEKQPTQALHYLHLLAEQKAQRDWAASREYEYLITLPISSHTSSLWVVFISRYAGLDAADKAQIELDRQTALLGDQSWQTGQTGLRLLEQGNSAQAITHFKRAIAAYPNDVELHGALGLAYLRQGDRTRALQYFRLAKAKEQRDDQTSKWISLIASTEYWLLLEQASEAFKREDWVQAQQLYRQAYQRDSRNIFALLGLADTALATQQPDIAWGYFKRALQTAPGDEVAQLGVLRYLATLSSEQTLDILIPLKPQNARLFIQAKRDLQIDLLEQRATYAEQESRWHDQLDILREIQQLNLADPWASYRLALALRKQGNETGALEAYQLHLSAHPHVSISRYAHGLLLASVARWDATLNTLNTVPKHAWTTDMHNLAQRVIDARLINLAQQRYSNGDISQAFALLETEPQSQTARLQVAQWSYDAGDYTKSLAYYTQALQAEPDNRDARLGQLENWAAQGKLEQVRDVLDGAELKFTDPQSSTYRRIVNLWLLVGEKKRAQTILQQRAKQLTEPDALLYRDLARLTSTQDPQQALNWYAYGMRDAGLLPPVAISAQRDDVAFTTAMRETEDDDWLARGLRTEAAKIYLRETATFTLHTDIWWRSDGTTGLSKLNANTTMAHLEFPLTQGRAFLRADHVRMDAGTLKKDADGRYSGRFGSCSLAECWHGLTQKADGTSFATGWYDEQLSFDIGSTPDDFTVQNWTGGISYSDKTGVTGWRLTASRRPLSNSLLSFAGAKDPGTGIKWGGVIANGVSLGLGWDQGNANGVWADISHHQLSGKNIADNTRSRVMGGYYRRLINTPNELLTVGVASMLWHHKKDLSEYTLGHGGYYSPQRYISLSLPIKYSRRTLDWSYILEGSVSASVSKTGNMAYFPKQGLIAAPFQGKASKDRSKGSSGRGVGYSLRGSVEHRLNSNWVLGTGIDWQHSKDYSPNRAMLYLRYSFEPWQGNLKLPIEPLIPYADFK